MLVNSFSYGQLMQTNNTPGGYQWKAAKFDSLLIMPTGEDTPTISNTKYGVPTKGAFFYKTSDSTFWIRSLYKWNLIGGSSSGSGPTIISGTLTAPSDVIILPAGKLCREILLFGSGAVSIGRTPGGTDVANSFNIGGYTPPQYVVGFTAKPISDLTLYVITEQTITYQIYLQ